MQFVNRSNRCPLQFALLVRVPTNDTLSTTRRFQPASAGRRKTNPNVLKWARQLHLLLGVFFAPSIMFFAFTGALQTFGLHESAPGSSYQPPVWLQKMAQLHKKQNLQLRSPRPPSAAGTEKRPQRPPEQKSSNWALKTFVAAAAVGLLVTSVLGIYMAFKFGRSRVQVWSLLIAGTVAPLLLILL